MIFFFLLLWFSSLLGLIWVIGTNKFGKANDFQTRRLYFAGVILSGLGLLFLFAMGMYAFNPNPDTTVGKDILDTAKTIIPPIITLVLGYYFGQDNPEAEKSSKEKENADTSDAGNAAPGKPY